MIQIRQNQIEAMDKMMLDKEVIELSARLADDHPAAVGQACPEPEQRENFVIRAPRHSILDLHATISHHFPAPATPAYTEAP
jgi:hypothetical protein